MPVAEPPTLTTQFNIPFEAAPPDDPFTPEGAANILLRRRMAREHLLDFTTYTWDGFNANWHHEVTCEYLDKFANGEIQNLMVFQPAQHGKSELCSRRFPSYMLGRNPDTKILAASYGADLAQGMNRDVQRIIDSVEYRELFKQTTLNGSNVRTIAGSWLRNNDIFEVVGRRGMYRCAGVGGGLTGFACDIGILDDPYKDFEQAQSPATRKKVWEWYTSVFLRRLHKRARQLFVLTRWHEDDLAGMLLKLQPERWTVLRLQGIKEEISPDTIGWCPQDPRAVGEALWPDRFDTEQLLMQKALNRYQFEAMTQQNPKPLEGARFKRAWFINKIKPVAPLNAKRVLRWDLAATMDDGDYTVGILMSQSSEGYFIEKMWRFRLETDERNEAIINAAYEVAGRHGKHGFKIMGPQDPGSAGKDTARAFKKMLTGFDVDTERETGKKEVRAEPFRQQCAAGNVFFVDESALLSDALVPEWIADIIEELCSFNNGVHDDIVDACSGGFNELARDTGWVHDSNVMAWLKARTQLNQVVQEEADEDETVMPTETAQAMAVAMQAQRLHSTQAVPQHDTIKPNAAHSLIPAVVAVPVKEQVPRKAAPAAGPIGIRLPSEVPNREKPAPPPVVVVPIPNRR